MKDRITLRPVLLWCALAALLLGSAIPASAAQIDVAPGGSIQTAIAAAAAGDEVVLAPGVYVERITFAGKAITVRSSDPADPAVVAATVIEAAASGPVVSIESGEGPGSVLDGLTVRHQPGFLYEGVAIRGSATVRRCVITGNSGVWGGGVSVKFGGNPRIEGCTIEGNSAEFSGGGILLYEASATIDSCVIRNNRGAVTSSIEGGGGIAVQGKSTLSVTALITNSVITDNWASWEGGGIHVFKYARAVVQGCTVSRNSTQGRGGGVFVRVYSTLEIADSMVEGNSAGYAGGGLRVSDFCTVSLRNSTFSGNGVNNPYLNDGGGAAIDHSILGVDGCTFRGNRAGYGGGIHASSSQATISGSLFEDNVATYVGGGLRIYEGYYLGQASSLTGSTFRNNRSVTGGGADLYGPLAPIEDCTFTGNTAENGGGANLSNPSYAQTLVRCSVSGNTANHGGGIFGSRIAILQSDVSGNAALYHGAGVFGDNLDISNTTLTKNRVTFTSPYPGYGYGGAAVYGRSGPVRITNCTVADNTSNYMSGGFYGSGAALTVLNSIFWNPGAPLEITAGSLDSLFVTFSDVRGGYAGAGNISADPLFVRPDLGDYRLRDQSPCIDRGTNDGAPTGDKNGALRPQDGNQDGVAVCDLGAFEGGVYTNVAPVANAGLGQTVHAGALVSLDGTGSSDPDENYPLAYQWTIVSRPAASTAAISDPTAATPTFTADKPGGYLVELLVRDALGLQSLPTTVHVSTLNTAPVSDAGDDVPVIEIGSVVVLDGSRSYDLDGDPLGFLWSFLSRPAGSLAEVSDASASAPTFVADVHGTYILQLVASDPWLAGNADTVTVSFTNLPPVSNPGGNQSVLQGDLVSLSGSASTDPNGDPLRYRWGFVTLPPGSAAVLSDPAGVQPTFVADAPGLYVVGLVVGDGFVESETRTVQVYAATRRDASVDLLQRLVVTVNLTPDALVKNPNMKNALTNKINEVIRLVEAGRYGQAVDKLKNDIRAKTDGCAAHGAPDANDWIEDCAIQSELYGQIEAILALLAPLVP
jgi:hypothetical protein